MSSTPRIDNGRDSLKLVRDDSYSLVLAVFGQVTSRIVEFLDVKTLLRLACTNKSNHGLVQYEVKRRKQRISDMKKEIASLLDSALTSELRYLVPRHDLFTRALALQEQGVALIDSGLEQCALHPVHGHVCQCHRDPLFHEPRRLLMIHSNQSSVEQPMLPLIFYCSPDDHDSCMSHVIYRTLLRRNAISMQEGDGDGAVWDQFNILSENLLILGMQTFTTIGPLEAQETPFFENIQSAEFRRCAQELADLCFQAGIWEIFRAVARRAVLKSPHAIAFHLLEIHQYTLMKMDNILKDFTNHKLRMDAAFNELTSNMQDVEVVNNIASDANEWSLL